MNRIKANLAAVILTGVAISTANADEFFTNINSSGSDVPVNFTYSTTKTPNANTISAVNYLPVLNHKRVVHGLIVTNSDSTAVTVTFSKTSNTFTAVTTGTGAAKKTTYTPSATTGIIQSIIIVPANTTLVVPLQAGMSFLRSKANVVEDLLVALDTTGSANVNLTLDFQDIAN